VYQARYRAQQAAALRLHAAARGHLARDMKRRHLGASTVIAARVRRRQQRAAYVKASAAAALLNRQLRRRAGQRRYALTIEQIVRSQAVGRRFLARCKFTHEMRAAKAIQKAMHGKIVRSRYAKQSASILAIQAAGRMAVYKARFRKTCGATLRIQGCARGYAARLNLQMAVGAAVWLQACIRRHLGAQYVLRVRRAHALLQRTVGRGGLARRAYLRERGAVVAIQRGVRLWLMGGAVAQVVLLQRAARGLRARRRYAAQRAAVLTLARAVRGLQGRRRFLQQLVGSTRSGTLTMRKIATSNFSIPGWQTRHFKLHAASGGPGGEERNAGFISWERQAKVDELGEDKCHAVPAGGGRGRVQSIKDGRGGGGGKGGGRKGGGGDDGGHAVSGFASGALELLPMVSFVLVCEDYGPRRPWCFVVRGRHMDVGKAGQRNGRTRDLFLQAESREQMEAWVRAIHAKIIQEMLKATTQSSGLSVGQFRQHTAGALASRRPRAGSTSATAVLSVGRAVSRSVSSRLEARGGGSAGGGSAGGESRARLGSSSVRVTKEERREASILSRMGSSFNKSKGRLLKKQLPGGGEQAEAAAAAAGAAGQASPSSSLPSSLPSSPSPQPAPLPEDLSSLGIKALKTALRERGIRHDDCLTKADLVERLGQHVNAKKPQGGAGAAGASPATAAPEPAEEDLSSLGIKALKTRLREAGVKHDDCLTKADLVERLGQHVHASKGKQAASAPPASAPAPAASASGAEAEAEAEAPTDGSDKNVKPGRSRHSMHKSSMLKDQFTKGGYGASNKAILKNNQKKSRGKKKKESAARSANSGAAGKVVGADDLMSMLDTGHRKESSVPPPAEPEPEQQQQQQQATEVREVLDDEPAEPEPAEEDLSSLGIKALKTRLREAGVAHNDCLTKADLVERLKSSLAPM
jgi:hypothetical protein